MRARRPWPPTALRETTLTLSCADVPEMKRIALHIFVPALAPAAVVALYFTPVAWLGCVNRGLAALAVVIIALLAGIAAAMQALRLKTARDRASGWWALSGAILALPALLVIGPLG